MVHVKSIERPFEVIKICITDEGEFFTSYFDKSINTSQVTWYDANGEIKQEISPVPSCCHNFEYITSSVYLAVVDIQGRSHIAMSCRYCTEIVLYDPDRHVHTMAYKAARGEHFEPYRMIPGSGGELFVINRYGPGKSVTIFDIGTTEFLVKKQLDVGIRADIIAYHRSILFAAIENSAHLKATDMENGKQIWVLKGRVTEIDGKNIHFNGMCVNDEGQVFLTDGRKHILMLDGESGAILKIMSHPIFKSLWGVFWCSSTRELIALNGTDGKYYLSCFKLKG